MPTSMKLAILAVHLNETVMAIPAFENLISISMLPIN